MNHTKRIMVFPSQCRLGKPLSFQGVKGMLIFNLLIVYRDIAHARTLSLYLSLSLSDTHTQTRAPAHTHTVINWQNIEAEASVMTDFLIFWKFDFSFQRGDRETESSWALHETSRARKNRTIQERFRYYLLSTKHAPNKPSYLISNPFWKWFNYTRF